MYIRQSCIESSIRNTLLEAKLKVPDILYSHELINANPAPAPKIKAALPIVPKIVDELHPLDICLNKAKKEMKVNTILVEKSVEKEIQGHSGDATMTKEDILMRNGIMELGQELGIAILTLLEASSIPIKEIVGTGGARENFFKNNRKWTSKVIQTVEQLKVDHKNLTDILEVFNLEELVKISKASTVPAIQLGGLLRGRIPAKSKSKASLESSIEKIRKLAKDITVLANNIDVAKIAKKMAEKAKKRKLITKIVQKKAPLPIDDHVAPEQPVTFQSVVEEVIRLEIEETIPDPDPEPEPEDSPDNRVSSEDVQASHESLSVNFSSFRMTEEPALPDIQNSSESLESTSSDPPKEAYQEPEAAPPVVEDTTNIAEQPAPIVERRQSQMLSIAEMRKLQFQKMQNKLEPKPPQPAKYTIPGGFSGAGGFSSNWRDDMEEDDDEPVVALPARRRGAAVPIPVMLEDDDSLKQEEKLLQAFALRITLG
ncbi:MAG: hypothetical protein SGCHY_000664 [Lobulomycetales sp.]